MTRGFVSLLGVSFFGAANDNILKQVLTFMVATGIWAGSLGEGSQGIVGLCLTVPFILLSGYGGQLSDKFSKRTVILWVKIAEVPIAITACVGLAFGNLWLSLGGLLLLAIQSSFYGPAKFGVIPDLVDDQRLSQANGLINMLTNIAVILGSLAAGPLSDLYAPAKPVPPTTLVRAMEHPIGDVVPQDLPVDADLAAAAVAPAEKSSGNKWVPGIALVTVALLGLLCVSTFPPQGARDPQLKFNYNPFYTYVQTFRELDTPLMTVMFSWSGFYMIGMMALLIIPEYQVILGIDYTQTSYLVGTLGVAVAIGSVTAGLLSGKQIRPYFIPFGAIGMTVCFALMGTLTPSYLLVTSLIFLTGFFAGFYIIPLQSLLQLLSPEDERGRFFGTANALSFVFSTLGSLLYWALTGALGIPANRVPLACALIAMIGTVIGMIQLNRIMSKQKKAHTEHDDPSKVS
jgi:MFS family permease